MEIQENLEEYVNDENKIVTYRWLSLTHNINVNSAKQALYTFVIAQRNKGGNDDINVTYFVAGLGKTKKGDPIHKCVVVPETHLDLVKSEFEPVTSCHVYSVQKSKLKDTSPLHQTDYDIIRENLTVSPSLSSIVCPWAVKHDPNTKTISKGNEKTTAKPETIVKTEVKSASPTKKTNLSSPSKSSSNETKKKAENKGSIASMFATATKKNEGQKNAPAVGKNGNSNEKPKASEKPKANEKKGGVKSFFATQTKVTTSNTTQEKSSKDKVDKPSNDKLEDKKSKNGKPKKDEEDADEFPQRGRRRIKRAGLFDSSSEDEMEEEEPVESHEMSEEEEKENEEGISVEEKQKSTKVSKVEISKKDKDKIKEQNENKKRKEVEKDKKERDEIKEPNAKKKKKDLDDLKNFEKTLKPTKPNEDSDVKEENKSEDVDVVIKKTSTSGSRKRKRTRKLVPKHTVDEDGFMVTEKVWESDSTDASDSEEENQIQEQKKEPSSTKSVKVDNKPKAQQKKSVALPVKGKQQSLMSFFKKK